MYVKTTDGGSNWVILNSPLSYELNSFCFIDSNNGYVATSILWTGSGQIQKTTDGGKSWTLQSYCHPLFSISFAHLNNGVAVGDHGLDTYNYRWWHNLEFAIKCDKTRVI